MPENLILALAWLSIVVLVGALGVLIARWKRALSRDAKWLLAALLVFSVLHAISNLSEWSSTEMQAEPLEDYFLLLLPAIWGCFFYTFLQEQSRSELRRSEERYRSLTDDVLDTTSAGICILDGAGRVVWINQTLEDYFGLRRDEARLVEDRLKHLFENSDQWANRVQAARRDHETVEFECHINAGEHCEERWLEYRSREVTSGLYQGGRIEHYYDITERKTTSQQREQLLEKVEAQKAELERFTYTVSHDLKTPLITIRGFLGLLSENLGNGSLDDAREDLQRIENAAGKMERLLEELLNLARIGHEGDTAERVDLTEIVAEALEIVHGKIERHRAAVTVHDGMPAVWGQRARLLEVAQNLIDNAVKYLGDQPQPVIEIGAEQHDDEVRCFVRDNGIGIDPRYTHRIFDLFEQLDPQKDGTGIGLAVVKRIVETHGGRLWVESTGEGRGSTFWFALPRPRSVNVRIAGDTQAPPAGENSPV